VLAAIDIGTVGGALGLVSLLAAAGVVFRGASAKATIDLQDKRIHALEQALEAEEKERAEDAGRCKDAISALERESRDRILKLETSNEVLTEKLTSAAAVKLLTDVLQTSIDEARGDHAALARLIGGELRQRQEAE
jgi:hypothetical protein